MGFALYSDVLKNFAHHTPMSSAILSPGRPPLNYGDLWSQIQNVAAAINSMGFGRGDRIGIMLPTGPAAAVAFLSVASCATSVMLDPTCQNEELDSLLSDLRLSAVIVPLGTTYPALASVRRRDIPIISLGQLEHAPAGNFSLIGPCSNTISSARFAKPTDIAVILQTSGTGARPRLVPLTHTNILASAMNNRDAYDLNKDDRCLDFMPLFNAHGLIMTFLTSLVAGGSVICTTGFDAPSFLGWLEEMNPTWYSAVPTIHEAIAARAANQPISALHHSLRFIRSASSPLPPRLMAELETRLGVPVLEGYGMTEASSQVTTNPLPPGRRKPHSVGQSAGSEVAVMNDAGDLLGPNKVGEITVRGASVMSGYCYDEAANRVAFAGNRFRTGDLGYLDTDGYLFVVGRLKEMINRGGQKIAPREVDEVLMDHVSVAYATTFSLPHPTLGEDVAAAVVLREGKRASEKELRDFAAARLPYSKTPKRLFVVDEIPKSATGKPLRLALTEKFGSDKADAVAFAPARTRDEELLETIWVEVFRFGSIGIHDDFFILGGDSLRAMQIASRVADTFGVLVTLADYFDQPTIAEMTALIVARAHSSRRA